MKANAPTMAVGAAQDMNHAILASMHARGYLNNSASPSSAMQSNGVFLSQKFVTANKLKLART